MIIQFLLANSYLWLYDYIITLVIFVHVMFVSICLGLSYEPFYSVTTEIIMDPPLHIPLDGSHYTTLCQCVPHTPWRRWQFCIKTWMVMQNWSLEAILVLKYDTWGFMMDTQATLDGYGRWRPNQCCSKTKHPYITQEHGLTASCSTHIAHLMGQWCEGHFHIHCSEEAGFLEYLRAGLWWVSNASSELKPVHMGQLVVYMVLVRVYRLP